MDAQTEQEVRNLRFERRQPLVQDLWRPFEADGKDGRFHEDTGGRMPGQPQCDVLARIFRDVLEGTEPGHEHKGGARHRPYDSHLDGQGTRRSSPCCQMWMGFRRLVLMR